MRFNYLCRLLQNNFTSLDATIFCYLMICQTSIILMKLIVCTLLFPMENKAKLLANRDIVEFEKRLYCSKLKF